MENLIEYSNFIMESGEPLKIYTTEDIKKMLGREDEVEFKKDSLRVKGLIWIYYLDIGGRPGDKLGFDRMDRETYIGMAKRLLDNYELKSHEMGMIRSRLPHYASQLAKVANWVNNNYVPKEIEDFINKWEEKNKVLYEKPVIINKETPKQLGLFN